MIIASLLFLGSTMAIWYDIVDIIANGPTTVKKRAETPRDSGEKILVIIGEEAIVIS